MIHDIGQEVQAQLVARGCPLKVIDGPEATKTTTYARERIVIEYDESAADSFSATRSQRRNPSERLIRNIAVKITIYAQATSSHATQWEHRQRAEHVLDLILVSLDYVLRVRKNDYVLNRGRFVQPDDLSKSEVIGGAVYELTFTVERGVYDTKWNGAAKPEAPIAGGMIKSTTQVLLADGPVGETPETGCGG